MEYLPIGKFAKEIGVTTATLRNWHDNGTLIPHHVSSGGHRYYTKDQLNAYLYGSLEKERLTIGYCRVSSNHQKDDLKRQIHLVESYLASKGKPFKIITDIGSGINYKKKGLVELIETVQQGNVKKVVVLYKDRLLRFGVELLDVVFSHYGTTIEIIQNNNKTPEEELTTDLIQILTVFSARLNGSRSRQTKKLLDELKDNDE